MEPTLRLISNPAWKSIPGKRADVPHFHISEKQSANQKAPIEPPFDVGTLFVCQKQVDLRQHQTSQNHKMEKHKPDDDTISKLTLPSSPPLLPLPPPLFHLCGFHSGKACWVSSVSMETGVGVVVVVGKVYPPAFWSSSSKCHDSRCISS